MNITKTENGYLLEDPQTSNEAQALEEAESRGFAHGVAWSAAFHGEFGGCNTEEFISEAGYTWEGLKEKGVPNYDLKRIARAIGQPGVKSLRRKSKCT